LDTERDSETDKAQTENSDREQTTININRHGHRWWLIHTRAGEPEEHRQVVA
jgi:hypothetical protein